MATVFTCEHPVKIRNKYTNEVQYVPCGKCACCKSKRASFWTSKLNRESKCHPYVIFGTLTYSPVFLPVLEQRYHDGDLYFEDGSLSLSFNELENFLDYDSKKYIELYKGFLPYLKFEDAQGFIKRLRERIRTNGSGEKSSCRYLRYFLCGEYGETALRPHFHFIFYTGSKWFAEHAKDVVASCWSTDNRLADKKELGRVDVQLVSNSASSYVASYLTCNDSIPKVYSFRKLRPRALFSKHPPLGSLFSKSEEIFELFNSGSVTRSVRREGNEVFQSVLPKDVSDRLYPRIQGFGRMAVDDLRRIYKLSDEFVTEGFDEFFFHVLKLADSNLFVSPYFKKLLSENAKTVHDSTLRVFLSTIKRFAYQSLIFDISQDDYFDKIVDFWCRRDKKLLEYQCQWQSDLSQRDKNLREFSQYGFDLAFVDKARNVSDFNVLSDYVQKEDIDSLSRSLECSPYDDVEFVDLVSMSNKIVHDGKNKHIKFEYLNKARIDSELKNFYKYLISKKVS